MASRAFVCTEFRQLLEALSSEQRSRAVFPFTAEERLNWHFGPRPRKGLPLKEMADRRVRHPGEVCAVAQAVPVRVLGVEPERRRISLSMNGLEPRG